MADSDHDIAAAMIANALIGQCHSRKAATDKAAERIEKLTDPDYKRFWGKVHGLLRSGQPIAPYRGHFESIPRIPLRQGGR